MKAKVKPVEKKQALKEYLKPRTENIKETEDGKLEVEIQEPEKLSKISGVDSYTVDGEEYDGIGGTPIHGKAFAKIESRKDAARAFLATLDGYTLYIVGSNREWDVRSLKQYNSEIIELKSPEVAEKFDFDRKVNYGDEDFPVSEEELLKIYMEFLA
ncbi:hypothetical protein [Candidatus Nanohalobium constans]|uniref:Uncharacterized protein n=1 Tax=Candidatus Nanohalobium constans TaxID=2565781 RepID=A0A5Q0UI70_9ARCH|nr:hypothetical protein [Candidatus Nanohalobium constans]QGA80625.1 hypothetical protein LC1Nh_0739 [Candidatus Nanohalobium constans]